MKLRLAKTHEVDIAMEIIIEAKRHLKQQGINQWQLGYPDYNCIRQDIKGKRAFLLLTRINY